MPLPPPARPRILIVEDNQGVGETMALMLEDDYEIDLVASARTALSHLDARAASPVDVILLDCLLPDGGSTNVLAEADRRSIPVVLISGDPDQREAMGPHRRFLRKPFTQLALLEALDNARR